MKRIITTNIILFFILFMSATCAFGQAEEYLTRVKLKDGSVLEGQLTEYVDGEYIKMNIGENQITIKHSSIKSLQHKSKGSSRVYSFKETAFYHHTSLGFLPGFISGGNPVVGVQLDHSSGYQFSRLLGAGLNFNVMNYDPASNEVLYTLSAELRGYLLKQYISPYYLLRSGYGMARAGDSFLEADGGFFLNPAVGFRLTGKKTANITAEIGLCFQNAHFKQQTEWWDRSVVEKDVRYQRFNFKIGILF